MSSFWGFESRDHSSSVEESSWIGKSNQLCLYSPFWRLARLELSLQNPLTLLRFEE
jgi:hypothetical protein